MTTRFKEWSMPRPLGNTGLSVSPIGFGSFKIGRNEKTKYAESYALPDDREVERLVGGLLDLGITYFDTAPAYGTSEERLGRVLGARRREITLSTKVGEIFEAGQSRYDFTDSSVRASVERSLRRLGTDVVDIVFLHAHAADVEIQQSSGAVEALRALKQAGHVRAIGLSGKTVEGARLAMEWADLIMVEYHALDASHAQVMTAAAQRGLGVVVKKGLASGRLDPRTAIGFVLGHPAVGSLVVGGLNLDHMRANVEIASACVSRVPHLASGHCD